MIVVLSDEIVDGASEWPPLFTEAVQLLSPGIRQAVVLAHRTGIRGLLVGADQPLRPQPAQHRIQGADTRDHAVLDQGFRQLPAVHRLAGEQAEYTTLDHSFAELRLDIRCHASQATL